MVLVEEEPNASFTARSTSGCLGPTWELQEDWPLLYRSTFHHGANLEKTLKCLDYEKYLSPNDQETPLDINATVELKKLDHLNIEIFVSI